MPASLEIAWQMFQAQLYIVEEKLKTQKKIVTDAKEDLQDIINSLQELAEEAEICEFFLLFSAPAMKIISENWILFNFIYGHCRL